MHGADEGKEGTKMKCRQGGTRFDCPKSKKKSRKLKARDAFFSELVRFWEERRAASCSVQRGRHSTKLKNKFFCRKRVGRHRTSN